MHVLLSYFPSLNIINVNYHLYNGVTPGIQKKYYCSCLAFVHVSGVESDRNGLLVLLLLLLLYCP